MTRQQFSFAFMLGIEEIKEGNEKIETITGTVICKFKHNP